MPTRRLNEQVKRNAERFPEDFFFQLTARELADLRSQGAITADGRVALRSQIATLKRESPHHLPHQLPVGRAAFRSLGLSRQ